MSDSAGILYTNHATLSAGSPIASLWSYENCAYSAQRPSVARNRDGNEEYWLDRSDPLLNTILPGTHLSIVVNLGDLWAAGRTPATSAQLPRASVIGPFTASHLLDVGRSVRAIGGVVAPTLASSVIGVPTAEVVDRIVPLEEFWGRDTVERLLGQIANLDQRSGIGRLRRELVDRCSSAQDHRQFGRLALQLIRSRGARSSIDALARTHGLSRQLFARRFREAAGLHPRLFSRIARFQSLVPALLASDVSRWSSVALDAGYYDQAHMINEFREFAGSAPTRFFRPRGETIGPQRIRVRGRPSEWVKR